MLQLTINGRPPSHLNCIALQIKCCTSRDNQFRNFQLNKFLDAVPSPQAVRLGKNGNMVVNLPNYQKQPQNKLAGFEE